MCRIKGVGEWASPPSSALYLFIYLLVTGSIGKVNYTGMFGAALRRNVLTDRLCFCLNCSFRAQWCENLISRSTLRALDIEDVNDTFS